MQAKQHELEAAFRLQVGALALGKRKRRMPHESFALACRIAVKQEADLGTRPRLDLVSQYQLNALGNNLLSYDKNGNSFYQNLSRSNTDGFTAGVQMSMPVGFRSAHTQVQNYELRLTKAHKALEASEEEIAQEMAVAFQEIAKSYSLAKTNLNRYLAAEENVKYLEPSFRERDILLDVYLRAQARRADAQQAYYQSLVDYNKSITNLYYRKGTLLAYNNIRVAEGGWSCEAYQDAERLHGQRAHGHDIDVEAQPPVFASPVPVGEVQSTTYPSTPATTLPEPADVPAEAAEKTDP